MAGLVGDEPFRSGASQSGCSQVNGLVRNPRESSKYGLSGVVFCTRIAPSRTVIGITVSVYDFQFFSASSFTSPVTSAA